MLLYYIEKLQALGQLSFTLDQAIKDLNTTSDSVISAAYRLKKKGKLISPAKGFYVIIPAGEQQFGSLPAEDLVPLLAEYHGFNYYACLLTAAMHYGAAHQRPAVFQIFIDRRQKKRLKFGKVFIECFYKKDLNKLPTKNFQVRTGYLKVATPEVTVMDLLNNPHKSGGLNNIGTIISELIESIDPIKILLLAKQSPHTTWLQRFGYVLEKLEPDDFSAKQRIINALESYMHLESLTYIPLAPDMPTVGCPQSAKWKIIENTTLESDV